MDVLRIADFTGAAPNISDAYTINGQPGDLYRCSKQGSPVILFFFFLLSDLFSSNFNL
jgi:hypothetical protein